MLNNEYCLKFTLAAEEDLDEIYSYIATKLFASTTAEGLMDKIENGIMGLKEFPFLGGYVHDELLKERGYRKLIVDNYIAFYLVNEAEKQVVIMRILYGATNYQDFL
jgi:toxin ParE1/3/4